MARFYVSPINLDDISKELLAKGFEKLDDCFDGNSAEYIFINKEDKNFYLCDAESLQQANDIIVEKFNETYKTIDLNAVKKWK